MNRLTVDDGYEKINHCSVCSSVNIGKTSLDNHTIVEINCSDCFAQYTINLVDDEE